MKIRRLIVLILTLSLIFYPLSMDASNLETFGDELDLLEELKEQKRKQDNEVAITQAEYDKTTKEIYNLTVEIEKLNKEIIQADEDIKKNQEEIEAKKEQTDTVLRFLQLSSGEKAYLEYIFKAKSFTEFIHRISIVEQISKDNKEQIAIMNNLIKQNNELKKRNEENIKTSEDKKVTLNSKLKSLGSKIRDLDSEGATIEEEITAQERWIQELRDKGCNNRNDKIATCLGIPSSTGFVRPLNTGVVTSEYYWRISPMTGKLETHSGIDLGVKEGTEVYPVAAGVVGAIIPRSSCGGNMLYVYHNVNGRNYTSVYMHLLRFGDVEVGDIVRLNDVIGYVGGSSTASYNGGYDQCTFGAHLHLTLATGHTTSHRSTMFNPRDMIYFPDGYWYSRTW